MSGTAKNGSRLVTSPVRWGAMAFSSLTNERRWWFMIEKILEVVFWSLKLLSAALDLFSAVKKSRHAKPNHWAGLIYCNLWGNNRLSVVPLYNYINNEKYFRQYFDLYHWFDRFVNQKCKINTFLALVNSFILFQD